MNTKESLALYSQGRDAWNEWARARQEDRNSLLNTSAWNGQVHPDKWNEPTQAWHSEARATFTKHTFDKNADFRDFIFPGDAVFEEANFVTKAGFQRVTFEGNAVFDRATFREEAEFAGARFANTVGFGRANFVSVAGFGGATFIGVARFGAAKFGGDARFSKTCFGDDAGFERTNFARDTKFERATFGGAAVFERAIFVGSVVFGEATFADDVRFQNTDFRSNADFERASFGGEGRFAWANFAGDAVFGKANFAGRAEFDNVDFRGNATFVGAGFGRDAWFRMTKFQGNAMFGGARFGNSVVFGSARFSGHAGFVSASFEGDAAFIGAQFGGSAGFVEATFGGDAGFEEVSFSGKAGFDGATFERTARFEAIDGARSFSLASVTFHVLPDFIQAHFTEAPRLDNCRIEERRSWPTTWSSTWAYFRGDPDRAARWQALKRLAIQGHDHERELWFFAGELKARRWSADRWCHAALWSGFFYQLLSDFGRSMVRPVAWWIVGTVVFATAYLSPHPAFDGRWLASVGWAYERVAGDGPSTEVACRSADGDPLWAALDLSLHKGLVVPGFGSAEKLNQDYRCLYGVERFEASADARRPARPLPNVPYAVSVLGVVQGVVSAVLIFLFLLAVRNHFRIK